jgi:hypothetical protein
LNSPSGIPPTSTICCSGSSVLTVIGNARLRVVCTVILAPSAGVPSTRSIAGSNVGQRPTSSNVDQTRSGVASIRVSVAKAFIPTIIVGRSAGVRALAPMTATLSGQPTTASPLTFS